MEVDVDHSTSNMGDIEVSANDGSTGKYEELVGAFASGEFLKEDEDLHDGRILRHSNFQGLH